MNAFEVEIPMKDHPLVITIKKRDTENSILYDLYYADKLCGCMFCNEHKVWIYEPHQEAALLLNEIQIQHLGKSIGEYK